MKVFANARSVIVVALACAAPLVASGCGSDFGSEHGTPVEKTGTLKTALSTIGSDGATYTFVTGSTLNLSRGTWSDSYPFDGPETVFTQTLGVGTYELGLQFGIYGSPVLTRTFNGETKNVNAIWTDPQPVTFGITPSATTNVVLHFTVPGMADVTFETGQVSVTAEVTKKDSAAPAFIVLSGTVQVGPVWFYDPAAQYATYFAESPGATRFFGIGLTPSDGWEAFGTSACIKVTVGSISSDPDPTATAFNERMLQFIFGAQGVGDLCIIDDGVDDLMELRLSAEGSLPASQSTALPSPPYIRTLYVSGRVGDVFDGATLKQTMLESGVTMVNGTFNHRLGEESFLLMTLLGSMTTGTLRTDPPLLP
jgi:hypothetical protein